MRNRFYFSGIGRFLQIDPKRHELFFFNELYIYCSNNPISFIDPQGLEKNVFRDIWDGVLDIFDGIANGLSWVPYPPVDKVFNDKHGEPKEGLLDNFKNGLSFPNEGSASDRRIRDILGPGELPKYGNKEKSAETSSEVVTPEDPNEKLGPPGVGEQHYVVGGEELTYTIYFENKATAAVPAQEVFVNDYLDSDLDWSTFRLGDVAFGDQVITTIAGKEWGEDRVIIDGMAVEIDAGRLPGTGLVSWTLRTIDLETGELPEDVFAGFLPPEDGTGRGQGYVTFSVRAKDDLVVNTRIRNTASIVFDTNEAIITNEVLNTITNDAPDAAHSTPNIAEGATDVSVSSVLSWTSCELATSYDLYIWKESEDHPSTPTATGLFSRFYDPAGLDYNTTYYWQVVAQNTMGGSAGPVWSFTTESPAYNISGYVLNLRGLGVEDVILTGLPGDPMTDFNGSYIATVPHDWSGTIAPQKGDCIFDPVTLSYSNVNAHHTQQNFALVDLVTIYLKKGFNLIAVPVDEATDLTDLLPLLGDSSEIEKVLVYDDQAGTFVTLLPWDSSSEGFMLNGGEGLIVYARQDKEVTFATVLCSALDLKPGFNLVGFACPADGYTAFQLLSDLGSANVVSIQRYSTNKGAFDTAGFGLDGQVVGVDFVIVPGEGYFVYMR